jgi:hypothetical protein
MQIQAISEQMPFYVKNVPYESAPKEVNCWKFEIPKT